jgi:uncharacterized protein (TIGR03083 family)
MQVSPRYDGPPVLEFDIAIDDVSVPLLRQRRRLGNFLATIDGSQWTATSRCAGWTVQDVIAHLIGTNQYWTVSIAGGLKGEPTRYLDGFDPVATPAQMVDGLRSMSPADVLAQYLASIEQLAEVLVGLGAANWSMVAEAPPGHIAIRAVALHALWDAWTHERDVCLPLGSRPPAEPDEIAGCLYYCAAIGPTLAATQGSTRDGALAVVATDPTLSFVVRTGSTVRVTDGPAPDGVARLAGDAVALVEGLTFRAPLEHGLAAEHEWLLGGLDQAFDRTGAA